MRALDAMMSLLPRRRSSVGRHEVARYTMTDFFNWQSQSMGYGGHQYGLGGSYGLNTTYGNRPVEAIGNSFEGYAGGLLFCDGPVASAEAYRLRVFGQAPMLFQKRVAGRPGDYYDDDSLNLFRRPWMGGTCSDLMKRALIHGDLGGQAYIVEIDGELVLLRPDWVEIVLAKRMYEGYQVGWTQVGIAYYEGGVGVTSDPALFVAGEYIHFVPGMPDPLATYRGMSWLTPVIREIQADKGASDHKVKWFENAATPNLAVSLPKEVTPTQFNEFVEQMDAKHKGAANAYKTLYTGGGADVTVIGANMQQMDFSNVEGKGETRIANAAGVPSTLLGFSEGMQGSSLNAGNYGPTKRNFVDTTGRDLWQNWCGSAEVLFPPPKDGDRLWYDPRDIPFLHEDQTDVATIKQIEASTMVSLVTAGFEKDSIIAATVAGDWSLLVDSGLVSVQLLPPGTTANDTAAPTGESGTKAPAAKRSREVARKFNPDQPRIPGGHEGGGRWGSGAIGSLIGSLKAIGGLGDVKFGDDGDDGLIDWSTRTSDGGFSFEASDENGEGVNFDLTRLEMSGLHEALTQHLTGDNDPGEFRYGEGDTGYIDWSSKKWVEFSSPDGEDAAVLNMPEERRQQWHTALTLSLLVDATGEAKRSLIHSLEAVARSQTAAGDAGPKAPAAASTPKGPPAKRSREVARKFNPDQPRIPGGHDGGGRWGTVGALKGTILSAVQDLETRPRAPVRIVDLRAHLADVPRADLDRTLKEMDLDGAVQLEPDPVRSKLTPEDKRDAISLGGEDMHLVVRMSDPAGESGPKAPAATADRSRGWDPAKHPRDPVTGRFVTAAAFAGLVKKLDNDRNGSFDRRLKDAASGDAALEAAPYKQWLEPEGPHAESVHFYTGGGYLGINGDLRIGHTTRQRNKAHIERLDEAMADSPLESDVVVVRGIRDPTVFGDKWNDTDVSGMEWMDPSFASSSTDISQTGRNYFTGDNGVRMEILVPKGTHALAASQTGESELLLDRGLSYRVVRDDGIVDGIRRLRVEVFRAR